MMHFLLSRAQILRSGLKNIDSLLVQSCDYLVHLDHADRSTVIPLAEYCYDDALRESIDLCEIGAKISRDSDGVLALPARGTQPLIMCFPLCCWPSRLLRHS